MRVLNVGGGPSRELPARYKGWTQILLDIDETVQPDLCADALTLKSNKGQAGKYDAVFCSHNLEHFYRHDVPAVLAGFLHVLKPSGYAEVAVPNVAFLMEQVVKGERDIMDTWYHAGPNPISFHDVLYGWDAAMSRGNTYYAHKCGFSPASLNKVLQDAGFETVYVFDEGPNVVAFAYKKTPKEPPCL